MKPYAFRLWFWDTIAMFWIHWGTFGCAIADWCFERWEYFRLKQLGVVE